MNKNIEKSLGEIFSTFDISWTPRYESDSYTFTLDDTTEANKVKEIFESSGINVCINTYANVSPVEVSLDVSVDDVKKLISKNN